MGYYNAKLSKDPDTGWPCIFYKQHRKDKVWWIDYPDIIGDLAISFDGVNIYHLFTGFPAGLTEQEKNLFCEENPFWCKFFGQERGERQSDRQRID